MKKSVVLLTMTLVFWSADIIFAQKAPVAVSPGDELCIAKVGTDCPTFSWTAVDWAVGYRVEVFRSIDGQVLSYREMAAIAHPVVVVEIMGTATAWTPSEQDRLSHSSQYVWYVQAIDNSGTEVWSEGKGFSVSLTAAFAPIEEAVSDSLRENHVSQEIVKDVLGDVRSKLGERPEAVSTDNPVPIRTQGVELTYKTLYGMGAGSSLTGVVGGSSFFGYMTGYETTSGYGNAFFGHWAGRFNTTADYNTFVGNYSGRENTVGSSNTSLGYMSSYLNQTGGGNVMLGYQAGYSNTSSYSVFAGYNAGYNNTSGQYNTYLGTEAGFTGTTANNNTFVGFHSGRENTIGSGNTTLGYLSGFSSVTGGGNVMLGYQAGYSNTSSYSMFAGYNAGYNNTTGEYNTYLGTAAGFTGTTASSNTFVGHGAGYNNTGHYNTFIGRYAGYTNTTGGHNVFLGFYAGCYNTTGAYNQFLGYQTGYNNTTGSSNSFVGYGAGYNNTEGNSNVFLGYAAGYDNETGTGNVFLGNEAGKHCERSSQLYIDNSDTDEPLIWGDFFNDTVAFMGTVGVGTKAPAYPMEMKKTGANASIVVDRTDGATNFINATATSGNFGTVTNHVLRLVVNSLWQMRLHTDNSLTMRNGASCTTGGVWTNASSRDLKDDIHDLSTEQAIEALNNLQPVTYKYKADIEDEHVGFIAEDVPDLVASKDRKGMSPMDVVAVLTKVVQEQQKIIAKLQTEVEDLKKDKIDQK